MEVRCAPSRYAGPNRLALSFLLFFLGCTGPAPRFLEVRPFGDTTDLAGAHLLTARIAGGDTPLRAHVRYAFSARALETSDCATGGPVPNWRNVDSGIDAAAPPPLCYLVPMRQEGGRLVARLESPVLQLGTEIHYRLEVVDDSGREARWPTDGAVTFRVGPVGDVLTLEGLAPTVGPSSGGTEFVLKGSGFGARTEVFFGGRRAAIEVASPQLVTGVVPARAPGQVDVLVTRGPSRAVLTEAFEYRPPPVIDDVNPSAGPLTDGTVVVLDGVGFLPMVTVTLDDEETEVPSTFIDGRRLALTMPAHAAGRVTLVVRNPDDQFATAVDAYEYVAPPKLTTFSPVRGTDAGGVAIQLVGEDLRAPAAVYFGDVESPSVVVSEDGLGAEVVTPPRVEGTYPIRFYNPDGQGARLDPGFVFQGPPVVTGAEPDIGARCGGLPITIVGQNFTETSRVLINNVAAEFVEVSDDGRRIVVIGPPGPIGPARIEVVNEDGRRVTDDSVLTLDRQPSIREVSPRRVPVWGIDDVLLRGGDLERTRGVNVGGRAVRQFEIVPAADPCDGLLVMDLPALEAGIYPVELVGEDGALAQLDDALEYVEPTLSPRAGLTPGYTTVVVRGIGLSAGLEVSFGERSPRAIERVSDEEWRIVTPANEVGDVDVVFSLPRQQRAATLTSAYRYRAFVDRTRGNLDAPGDCNDVEVGDIDGDGDLDVVGAFGGVGGLEPVEQSTGVFRNDGDGRFQRTGVVPRGNGLNSRLGDVDGDGDLDMLVSNLSSDNTYLFINDGRGGYQLSPNLRIRGSTYDGDFVDIDGDGDLDIFLVQIGEPENGNIAGAEQLFLNDGLGNFTDASARIPFSRTDVHDHDLDHGDLDGDGVVDLVIVVDRISRSFSSGRNRVLLNRGEDGFERVTDGINDAPGDWLDVKLVDVDGDGDLDIVMPQNFLEGFSVRGSPAIAVFLNDGSAGFEPAHDRIVGFPRLPAYEVVPRDLDDDGDIDFLVAVYGILFGDGRLDSFRSALLLNDGTGRFIESTTAFESIARIASTNFAVADFDGDGDLDLIECAGRGQSRYWRQE